MTHAAAFVLGLIVGAAMVAGITVWRRLRAESFTYPWQHRE